MKSCSKCKSSKEFSEFRTVKPGQGDKMNLHSWCKECERSARRKRRADNPEKYQEWNRNWNINNPERRKELDSNRDRNRKKEYNRQYAIDNKDKRRVIDHNYRARIRGAEGSLTAEVMNKVFAIYGKICLKCGSDKSIEIDHVVPLSLGGSNLFENLQPLCKSCNSAKGGRNCEDYRQGEGRVTG